MVSSTKRLLSWSDHDDGNDVAGELSRPRKRWRSIVLELRGRRAVDDGHGVFGFRGMKMGEEFMTMLLPVFGKMVQRVVSEEVEKALFRGFNAQPQPPRLLVGRDQRPRYQLMFLNDLKPVYTTMKLEAKDGSDLKVSIVERMENNQTCVVSFGHLSSAKVEVVVLHGDFNAKNEEYWTPEEFNKYIVRGRQKSVQLLTGNLTLKLNGGEAFLDNANFTDNSSFTSTKKFRLGLRLVNHHGDRVLEGITEPFRVKEYRVEGLKKHFPPLLDDKVWRLQKIGKNGAYHEALSSNGIVTVQMFLQSYVKDEENLKQIFSKMPAEAAWKAIIGHAMTCEVGNKLYLYEVKDNNMGLFFNAIHQLVGVKFGDCYKPIDKLNQIEKNLVETMKQEAYKNMDSVQYDYMMVNDYPVQLHAAGTSALTNFIPNQQILNSGQYNLSLGDFSTGQTFESNETFCSFQGATNTSMDVSRFVQGQTSNDVFSHQPVMANVIPHSSTQGSFLSERRITPLCIPNTEITDFSPDTTTAAVVNSNIQAGQIAIQIGQYGQNELFQSSGESYSLFSPDGLLSTESSRKSMLPTGESFSNQLGSTDQISRQFAIGFPPSRTNSFDPSSCEQLIQNFLSQMPSSEGTAMPLSPRNWVKIKAALKLASVGRLSRASRRGPHRPPARPRLVQTL